MATTQQPRTDFVKALSRLDATALVVGSMIGSGIFIVSADILRQVHAPGVLLLVWALSGVVTLMGALSYGGLAALFPPAGGQDRYLREGISPVSPHGAFAMCLVSGARNAGAAGGIGSNCGHVFRPAGGLAGAWGPVFGAEVVGSLF